MSIRDSRGKFPEYKSEALPPELSLSAPETSCILNIVHEIEVVRHICCVKAIYI
jgi:hypothetical protein